ncbi:MAG: hypothetical protein GX241_07600 [Ruminococcaceae bacterium]|nr:hypothetical protein [Oscillospiraceae bacterium]
MAIRFFFEFNNQIVQLPVNPEEIVLKSSGSNKVEEIIKIGEINLLREKKLAECTIEGFLPAAPNAPYIVTSGRFEPPEFYLEFFEKIRASKTPCRFIISDTDVNMLASIEDLEYGLKAGDPDTHYVMSLKEFRPFSAKTVVIKLPTIPTDPPKIEKPAPERPKTGFAIGDNVIVNGKYWYSSYGDSPFGTFSNFTGKISHIVADKSRKYRYHITTPSGGYRGWVAESQIKHK